MTFFSVFQLQLTFYSYIPVSECGFYFFMVQTQPSLLSSNLSTSLSLLKTCLFLELIEPKVPLFAYGCWGVLYKYLNTIQYNTDFHHCKFSFIAAHFVHHCTLNKPWRLMFLSNLHDFYPFLKCFLFSSDCMDWEHCWVGFLKESMWVTWYQFRVH